MPDATSKGIFLTIEGIEGVGKSTAVKYIENKLITAKKDFVITREPGGTPIAEQIRRILLTPDLDETILPNTELLLMFASRSQHVAQVILPALQQGKWVVSDRFVDASYAYQGAGRQIDLKHIHALETWILNQCKPTCTILLDAPPEVGLARAKHRGPHDRIEQEKIDFFERVRDGYLSRVKQDPTRFRVIDATQTVESVQTTLNTILKEFF